MRQWIQLPANEFSGFREKLVRFAGQQTCAAVLDSNSDLRSGIDLIAGLGIKRPGIPAPDSFSTLEMLHAAESDWMFGFLSYDLKNDLENLQSRHADISDFPLLHFFIPEYVLKLRDGFLEIGFDPLVTSESAARKLPVDILACSEAESDTRASSSMRQGMSREEYIRRVRKIQEHIRRGDIYEMNFCMEFYSDGWKADPVSIFQSINRISRSPFSAFYKLGSKFILCASPERFLKKSGSELISQPIKGTAARGKTLEEDERLKEALRRSEKDRTENIMIVDLVRNDLSRVCDQVGVTELCGVYTFPKWHQMISTIRGTLRNNLSLTAPIQSCFPMGSMTGAPKIRAMELIDKYETARRGVYSGAIGYITPEGDFDLNVVIRSILYDNESRHLSFQAGSAITAASVPEQEYEECLLKAQGMFEALERMPFPSPV